MQCRFSYCALLTLAILDRTAAISTPRAVAHVVACRNFDGGFGCNPGARSPPPAPIAQTAISCVQHEPRMAEAGPGHPSEWLQGGHKRACRSSSARASSGKILLTSTCVASHNAKTVCTELRLALIALVPMQLRGH